MDKATAAKEIIAHALPLVAFDGWTQLTLNNAAVAAGYKRTDAVRAFPGGAIEAVDAFMRLTDLAMAEALKAYNLETMKVRERIATAVRVRLMILAPHREAMRKAAALHAMPFYLHRGIKSLYATVDAIWYACGDTATDFNFYTKRLLLAGVYASTLLYWLDDKSADYGNSWEFLARRIDDVMQIQKARHSVSSWLGRKLA